MLLYLEKWHMTEESRTDVAWWKQEIDVVISLLSITIQNRIRNEEL